MLIKSWVDNLSNCKETVEKDIEELSEVTNSWESILNICEKHNKSNDDVFPTIKDEEIRKTIVEKSSMMKHQSV